MKKKILSMLTILIMICTMVCVGTVSSGAFSGEIKFEVPENLAKENKFFFFFFWKGITNECCYEWHSKGERMNWETGKDMAYYNVPDGDWNLLIVSGDSGMQTFDTVFNEKCFDDVCYIPADVELMEGPVDSGKSVYPLAWRINEDLGQHKTVTALGNVVGTTLLPEETNESLYQQFVSIYEGKDKLKNWEEFAMPVVGKDWETIKKEVAEQLGVKVGGEPATEAVTEKTSENATENVTENVTENATEHSTQASTNAPVNTNTSSASSTVSGKVVNTADRNVIVFSVVLVVALGVAFAVRKRKN